MRGTTPRPLLVALAVLSLGSFAGAQAFGSGGGSAARIPRLLAAPTVVHPGERLRLQGSGFGANAHLTLLATPPHGATTQIGTAVTGSRGTFAATIRIRARSAPGAFVALACQDSCRLKATARFRIVGR